MCSSHISSKGLQTPPLPRVPRICCTYTKAPDPTEHPLHIDRPLRDNEINDLLLASPPTKLAKLVFRLWLSSSRFPRLPASRSGVLRTKRESLRAYAYTMRYLAPPTDTGPRWMTLAEFPKPVSERRHRRIRSALVHILEVMSQANGVHGNYRAHNAVGEG